MELFDCHTHRLDCKRINSIYNANLEEDISSLHQSCSIGVHPWFLTGENVEMQVSATRVRSELKNVVAVGECGLDKLYSVDLELQKRAFHEMILISELYSKPLIIHCVRAFDELIAMKKKLKPKQPWIIHGYRGNYQQINQLLQFGFSFSIGEKCNEKAIKFLPLDYLFVETDDSLKEIDEIYQKIADIKQISVEELSKSINLNVKNTFKIDL